MPTRALTWANFTKAAVIVAGLCMAILHPFAHVIAWAATLAILCNPLLSATLRIDLGSSTARNAAL